jgi:hypothetical protein
MESGMREKEQTESDRTTRTERAWAVFRVALGVAQVMAATVTLVFLIRTGTTGLTTAATVITLFFFVVSKTLFARGK